MVGTLMLAGPLTVIPLLCFALAARRLNLSTIGVMQFISPTVQMLLAVTVLGETLTPDKLAAFVCVWVAVLIFIGDSVRQAREVRKKNARGRPSPGFEPATTFSQQTAVTR